MIWATRGRYWGFRFLLTGGFDDPLVAYERAFGAGALDQFGLFTTDSSVAFRFPDPDSRKDDFGRVIPHEIVLFGEEAAGITELDEAIDRSWPIVRELYSQVWESRVGPDSFDE